MIRPRPALLTVTADTMNRLARNPTRASLSRPLATSTQQCMASTSSSSKSYNSNAAPPSASPPPSSSTSSTSAPSPSPPPNSPPDPTPSPQATTQPPTPGKPLVVESFSSPSQLDKLPLPYLSTPLGVAQPPSSTPKTWTQKRNDLVSQDLRMSKRKAIVKEATRGYFHDFHAIRSHGGKTWRAPTSLIREDRALYLPDIAGSRLVDRQKTHTTDLVRGRVSVVCLLNSKISEEHTRSFYEQTWRTFASHPKFQLVQINIQENTLKAYLISLFLSTLRAQIAPELQRTYLLSNQSLELERDAIGYHNKHVGYTYLVAPDAKIRWAGCAFAEKEESNALASCTGVLLERLGEKARRK